MDRAVLQAQVDELMRRYDVGEIDGGTYAQKMMELTTSAQDCPTPLKTLEQSESH